MQTDTLHRLFALGAVLGPAMAEGLSKEGLTTARAEVIWRLHEQGPMNQRQLSEVLQCTPRNVTGLVDALEAAELVERRPHPTDRRATHVTLTKKGERAVDEWNEESSELAARLLAGIETTELARLASNLDLILQRLGVPMSHPNGADTPPPPSVSAPDPN
ncbi:MAG: MarR family transcriptional regulator [Acidimicrobiia bacterium]|nr:MarR family transcriptional regulator [Acidimicrobiia bacterium]